MAMGGLTESELGVVGAVVRVVVAPPRKRCLRITKGFLVGPVAASFLSSTWAPSRGEASVEITSAAKIVAATHAFATPVVVKESMVCRR
jgi:hypothetical protein